MPQPTHVLQASGFLALVLLAPASALAQTTLPLEPSLEPPLESWSELGRPAIAASTGQPTQATGLAEPALDLLASVVETPGPDLEGSLAASEAVAGVEGATDSAWVADSLTWLDQAVAAQAQVPRSGAQADSLGLLPSSTDSSDLQPIAAPLASEGLSQTPLVQPLDMAQTTSDPSQSNRWHFLAVPYIYIPFSISGSATFQGEGFRNDFVGDFIDPSRDFDFSPSQISAALRNSLNFAFFSGFEAWTPDYKIGIVANIDYVSLSTGSTINRDVRIPGAAAFVPTQVNASLNTQLWRGDLLGSYRFYDPARVNPEGVRSEYDLGPFVFDVLGGLSLIQINNQLGLSTNLGGNGQFNSTQTLVSPLIGGRARWNANPKLAVVGSATVSGFGLSGLMQYGIQGGVDWMFSGDTTLGAGYRFSFLDYSSDQVDLNVDQHGPYINIGFRF
jgi:hypothetical protein